MLPASTSGGFATSQQSVSFELDEHSMLQGTQAMMWFYTTSSNLSVAHKINWKMNGRVKAALDVKYYSPVKYQIGPSPELHL